MWTVGQIARKAGVNVETLRYYERNGLLPKPLRTGSGYRLYDAASLRRLRFIRRAKTLGFTLCEIRELLGLQVRRNGPDAKLRRKAEQKLAEVEAKITSLTHIRDVLSGLITQCRTGTAAGCRCPILENLETVENGDTAAQRGC